MQSVTVARVLFHTEIQIFCVLFYQQRAKEKTDLFGKQYMEDHDMYGNYSFPDLRQNLF